MLRMKNKTFRRLISLVSPGYSSLVRRKTKKSALVFERRFSLSRPIKRFIVLFCFRGSRWLIRDKDYVYFAGVCACGVLSLVSFFSFQGLMCLLMLFLIKELTRQFSTILSKWWYILISQITSSITLTIKIWYLRWCSQQIHTEYNKTIVLYN